MDYTITLSDAQVKAMEYIAREPLDWIENAAVARAYVATREIVQKNTAHCNANGIAIAVGEAGQIDQAYELGVIRTAKVVAEEEEAAIAASQAAAEAEAAAAAAAASE